MITDQLAKTAIISSSMDAICRFDEGGTIVHLFNNIHFICVPEKKRN